MKRKLLKILHQHFKINIKSDNYERDYERPKEIICVLRTSMYG